MAKETVEAYEGAGEAEKDAALEVEADEASEAAEESVEAYCTTIVRMKQETQKMLLLRRKLVHNQDERSSGSWW